MRKDVDWVAVRDAERALEAAGILPILLLTHDDVEMAVGRDMSVDEVEQTLHRFRRKWENGWADALPDFTPVAI